MIQEYVGLKKYAHDIHYTFFIYVPVCICINKNNNEQHLLNTTNGDMITAEPSELFYLQSL